MTRSPALSWMPYCLVWLSALALSGPAQAAFQDEIQVYDNAVNDKGEWGVELHLNTTPSTRSMPEEPGQASQRHALRITPELAYGLGHGWEAGLYLPSIADANGRFNLAGLKARMKWLAFEAVDGRGGFGGVNLELSRLARRYSMSRWSAETRFIAGWRNADWLWVANPTLGFDLSDGQGGRRPDLSVGLKGLRKVGEGLAAGLEAYAELGPLGRSLPSQQQDKRLFGVLDVDRKPWVFNLGIGRGLTDAADRWTVKAIFELPFP